MANSFPLWNLRKKPQVLGASFGRQLFVAKTSKFVYQWNLSAVLRIFFVAKFAGKLLFRFRSLQPSQMRAENLHAHGQASLRVTAWNGDAGNPRERSCNRINISKIHLQWIGRAFAQAERRRGRGGRDDGVYLLKCVREILSDQRANLW